MLTFSVAVAFIKKEAVIQIVCLLMMASTKKISKNKKKPKAEEKVVELVDQSEVERATQKEQNLRKRKNRRSK